MKLPFRILPVKSSTITVAENGSSQEKMKGDDSNVCINQKHHQRSEDWGSQILDRDTGQSGQNQQGKQAEVEKFADTHDCNGFPERKPHVFPHRHIPKNKEGKRI